MQQPDLPPTAPTQYRPKLSQSARPATFEVATRDEHGATGTAAIAGEHPLTVYVDKREILTLMTLGAAPEEDAHLRGGWQLARIDRQNLGPVRQRCMHGQVRQLLCSRTWTIDSFGFQALRVKRTPVLPSARHT